MKKGFLPWGIRSINMLFQGKKDLCLSVPSVKLPKEKIVRRKEDKDGI